MRCELRDAVGALAGHVLLRAPARPASAVLEAVLRCALAERRYGRMLTVVEPAEVAALVVALGLQGASAVTP